MTISPLYGATAMLEHGHVDHPARGRRRIRPAAIAALAAAIVIAVQLTAAGPVAAAGAVATARAVAAATPVPAIAGCRIFPASSWWNLRVDGLPVAADSDVLVRSIGIDAPLHPDFSSRGMYGIPFNVVTRVTPRSTVAFYYPDESDRVRYPIPPAPRIEAGSDRHILMLDRSACRLYELYDADRASGRWTAGSGATWSLRSNALRPAGWTSADAAGLPILPGLARYEEVAAGEIAHALRFTAPRTRTAFVYPARHQAGESDDPALPPMGLRVRLKASVDISGFGPQSQVVLRALQRYGMMLADNGAPWYAGGSPDARWDDDDLHRLGELTGADFEVVDTTTLTRTP